jgi:hypothetical protein
MSPFSPPLSITLPELRLLELRYDGPIPPQALAELRASPPRPIAVVCLSDVEVKHWQKLAHANLKAEQRRLATRRAQLLAVRATFTVSAAHKAHARDLAQREAVWSLKQCIASRMEWRSLTHEVMRRAHASHTLAPYARTLEALNNALGLSQQL